MKQIETLLEFFNEKHNDCMWLLARLIMCICVINLIVYALVTLGLFICPFILLIAGKGIVGFLAWYFIPVTLFVYWMLYKIVKTVYENYINTGLY